jgi:CARDB
MILHRSHRLSALLFSALIGALPCLSSNAETAHEADSFVESVGVNIHPWYPWAQLKDKVGELKIRYLRTGAETDPALMKELNDRFGSKFNLITLPTLSGSLVRDAVKRVGAKRVAMIEGLNEPSLFVPIDWQRTAHTTHQVTWNALQSDPETSSVPMITVSPVFPDDASQLGSLLPRCNGSNVHLYPAGNHPEREGESTWGTLEWASNVFSRITCVSRPTIVSESGYHNTRQTTGHVGTPDLNVVAKYLPRLFLHNFSKGIVRTFAYEMYDQGTDKSNQEQNFGLITNDFKSKPSAMAVRSLISILEDPGTRFLPKDVQVTLSGDLTNVRRILFQKRDGRYYFASWLATPSFDPARQVAFEVPPQKITVDFSGAGLSGEKVILHELSDRGPAAQKSLSLAQGKLNYEVKDTVSLIEFRPITTESSSLSPRYSDLVVVNVSSSTNEVGQEAIFQAEVKNQGLTSSSEGITHGVAFFVDGNLVSWADQNSRALAPGQTVTLRANGGPKGKSTWTTQDGNHSILAIVDDVNRIQELVEYNNSFQKNIDFLRGGKRAEETGRGCDLVVDSVELTTYQPQQVSRALAKVRNNGLAPCPEGVTYGVGFLLNSSPLGWYSHARAALQPNETFEAVSQGALQGDASWLTKEGTFKLTAVIDDVDRIKETNEANNSTEATVKVSFSGGGVVSAPPITPPIPSEKPTPPVTENESPRPALTAKERRVLLLKLILLKRKLLQLQESMSTSPRLVKRKKELKEQVRSLRSRLHSY